MRMTHELRAEHDSIMVGVGTILSDNPRLNARLSTSKKSPMPVILDTGLRTPLDAKFLKIEREKRSILYTSGLAVEETAENRTRREKFNDFNQIADVRTAPMHGEGKGLDFGAILQDLSQSNVDSIMVEGGSKVLTTVLVSGFADYIIVTVAPRMFGGGVPATRHAGAGYILPDVSDAQWHQVGDDIVLSGIPAKK